MQYIKACPKCNKKIIYKNKHQFKLSNKNNTSCMACVGKAKRHDLPEYKHCPTCNNIMTYKSRGALSLAIKNNTDCRKCASIKTGFTGRYGTKGKNTGKDNPFFGRKISEELREILKNLDRSYTQTEDFKQKMSIVTSGENNGMYGRSFYDVWLEKYGKDIADEKMSTLKKIHSENNLGEKSYWYGKSSPKGSGNGWSGHYNNHYFRSLRELSFIIDMDEKNINWKSAESIKIPYIKSDGNKSFYRPDFLYENYLIEIKPIKLMYIEINKLKKAAAILYCKENNLIYKMIDIEICFDKISKLFDDGMIIFTERYKEKFKKFRKKMGQNK